MLCRVDQPTIFGERNEKYIEAELEWYESQSLNVNDLFDIYGSTVKIWMMYPTKMAILTLIMGGVSTVKRMDYNTI